MTPPVPEVMRAAQFDRYGDSSVLAVRAIPVPGPGRDEVLVRVHASGLNPKDSIVRQGGLRLLTGRSFPRGTGYDFSGEVAARGARVTDLAHGDRVWGFLDGFLGGAAAEYVVARREWLAPMPRRLGWIEAAALPLVGTTALRGLRDAGRLRPGHRVLIKGASGGVGSAAIQIAKAMGGHVTALASGEGLDHCRALGADVVVDYRRTPAESLDERFDLFLDCIGGSPYRAYRRLFTRRGRWVTIAPEPMAYALTPISQILAPILGGPRFGYVAVRPRRADFEELARLVDRGVLRMPVTAMYPLEDIRTAQDVVGRRHGRGKQVLVVSAEAVSERDAGNEAVELS
ncbi:MAG TPA: NAD(P)-dependent alcohol dehydrogenase [Gemmatimonadales bacterium]|jgi:NADPH:quinone reductase-like Zn-dependent oxidoreductase|nr:NAD(P)-dependent alcohol dehydrogenase [Gemmatimonadales bacterium]